MLEPFDKYGRMDVDAFMDSFRPYLEANRRTTNTVFQVSLNPSPEDRLTDGQFRDIAQEYMERMGYGNQPYIVFKHKDISREHLHIVSLRVDEQGRKLPHDFEARRSMEILRDLERKYGLQPGIYIGIRWNSLLGIHNFKAEGEGEFVRNRQAWYKRLCEKMVTELCTRYGDLFMIWFDGGIGNCTLEIIGLIERNIPFS